MDDLQTFESGLEVACQIQDECATVLVKGPLTFPDAVGVTGVMQHVIEKQPPVVLLDLTDIERVDATGVAVLVGIGGDLKTAGNPGSDHRLRPPDTTPPAVHPRSEKSLS